MKMPTRKLRKLHRSQILHGDVNPILRKYAYKIPSNVDVSQVHRWHFGPYYGYGERGLWIPLNSLGGMAIKAFHSKTVRFPKRIDGILQKLLEGMSE